MKLVSVRKVIEARYGPDSPIANPLEFGITGLDEVSTETPLVLYCRVSTRMQELRKNLDNQAKYNTKALCDLGYIVIGKEREAASGWELTPDERPALARAVKLAKDKAAIIVVENYDRLIRSYGYSPTNNNLALPTEYELVQIRKLLGFVQVACIVPPTTKRFGKDGQRSAETKRGQKQKGRMGGRPRKKSPGYKKHLREAKAPEALRLRNAGHSIRKIAKMINVPRTTVSRWIISQ